ncbi:hypothetical protein POM88_035366 [Heracleum sosnowskyi]|uniref:Uncharacterized protein n=1 Tax=Heracleum sosnowskyi TaxID=360622 RepID=A0AAD8ME21_9APIA|nr:hypothetical protein POM88_035366 [Heracleum sosnowskyi]
MKVMDECHKKEWYLRVYSHLLEPLNGEEFREEKNETPILPLLPRIAPRRPKKKRDKTNDIVETRVNDPTMMKRTGTSLKCGWCNEWGHNTRTCNSKRVDQEKKLKEEGVQPDEGTSKERTCTKFHPPKVKDPVQQPNVKNSPVKHVLRSSSATATHGGIITPFKPSTQKKRPNCMDVEAVEGQKFTSLKNLKATRSMKQKYMGKRKD